jgi:hypothetical protein
MHAAEPDRDTPPCEDAARRVGRCADWCRCFFDTPLFKPGEDVWGDPSMGETGLSDLIDEVAMRSMSEEAVMDVA